MDAQWIPDIRNIPQTTKNRVLPPDDFTNQRKPALRCKERVASEARISRTVDKQRGSYNSKNVNNLRNVKNVKRRFKSYIGAYYKNLKGTYQKRARGEISQSPRPFINIYQTARQRQHPRRYRN